MEKFVHFSRIEIRNSPEIAWKFSSKPAGTDFHILIWGGGWKNIWGGAFSSKLIQLRLNSIYNSEFRYNWGGGGGGGSAETF